MSQEPLWLPHLCLVLPTPTPSCDTFPLSSQVWPTMLSEFTHESSGLLTPKFLLLCLSATSKVEVASTTCHLSSVSLEFLGLEKCSWLLVWLISEEWQGSHLHICKNQLTSTEPQVLF